MDAIIYLRKEHSKFRKTFKAISKISNPKLKLTKFKALCKDLIKHETMEQKAWYPVLRKDAELKSIISHLISEEKTAGKEIKKAKKEEFGLIWNIKFLKIKNDVDHHAREEETKLFPKVRKLLTKKELNALGTKMRKFKAKLK